jgi:hypothetical protein
MAAMTYTSRSPSSGLRRMAALSLPIQERRAAQSEGSASLSPWQGGTARPSRPSGRRADIMVHMEQVGRVVFFL